MQKNKDVIEIDVVEVFLFMLRRWWMFILSMVLVLAIGLSICMFVITPKYESTTKIIILNQQNNGTLTYSDMQLASQLTKDYEELIVSRDVLETVISECQLEDDYDDLLDRVKVENITDTRIISITVEDESPSMAQRIATSIRETAAEHIKSVTDVEAVNIAEEANLPVEQSSPSVLLWAVLSAAAGFLLVFVLLLVRFLSDDNIKSAEDVTKCLALSTFALIPVATDDAQGKGAKGQRSAKTPAKPGAHDVGTAKSGQTGGNGNGKW
jgi:capsular polysaccharide biosynthesis protein